MEYTLKDIYADCAEIKRKKPYDHVNEEIAKRIGSEYRTLPTYEKGLYEEVFKRHYSLHDNELLKCRWTQYKKHLEGRVFAPFQFPDVRDLHFYNCAIRFLPSESIHRRTKYGFKLKPGPGVDDFGQMPIPQELIIKRF
ncbi:uncharacterized protein LOC114244344 [Bombyx mandarina]|uniref:Uncharacterized protein n=2 Tax=Bombyx TaxID=7090 RepID=A0A8R2AMC7_BOMMO|nr:uncharacterized protein LOC101743976 [Bombyx mori]XP_028031918.1 uncharacterized protein LOC114244344 [Bombyx mandarina]